MIHPKFYGPGFPYNPIDELPGKLIVLEGTDGVGRSTQIELLKAWLEKRGHAVSDTGLRRSPLTGPGMTAAKTGHTFSPLTMSLFYAADFADRLENQILPALKAGFIVLSDRYFYSTMARDIVRGADPEWARKVYGFALIPDLTIYLKSDIDTVVSRIVHGRGFNYWEAGMDIHKADNLYESFYIYQTELIHQFDRMCEEFSFINVDATRSINAVFSDLRRLIEAFLVEDHSTLSK